MKGDEKTTPLSNWKVSGSSSTNQSELGARKTSSTSEEDVSSPFAALPDEVMEDILWSAIFVPEDHGDHSTRELDVENMLTLRKVSRQWSRCMPYDRLVNISYDDFEQQGFNPDGVMRFLLPRIGPFLRTIDTAYSTKILANCAIKARLEDYCPNFEGFSIYDELNEEDTEDLDEKIVAICAHAQLIKTADFDNRFPGPLTVSMDSKLKSAAFMKAVSKIPDVQLRLPCELFDLAKTHLVAPGLTSIRIELSAAHGANKLEKVFKNCPNIETVFLTCPADCLSKVYCVAKCTKLKFFELVFSFALQKNLVDTYDISGIVSVQKQCKKLKVLRFTLTGNFLPPGLLEYCGNLKKIVIEWGLKWGDWRQCTDVEAINWDKFPAENSLSEVKLCCHTPSFHLSTWSDKLGSHHRRQVLIMTDRILEHIKAANIRLKILDLRDETVKQSGQLTVKGLVSYLDFCGNRMHSIYFPIKDCNLYARKRLWRAFSRATNLRHLYLTGVTVDDLEKVKNTVVRFVNKRVSRVHRSKSEMTFEKVPVKALWLWNLPFKSRCWIENCPELGRDFLRRGNIFLAGNGSKGSSTSSDDESDSDSE